MINERSTHQHTSDEHDLPEVDLEHAPPVVVAVHADRGEAEVTRAHLAAHEITAEIVDQVEGGTVPVDGEPGVMVAVPAIDADRARAVLGAG